MRALGGRRPETLDSAYTETEKVFRRAAIVGTGGIARAFAKTAFAKKEPEWRALASASSAAAATTGCPTLKGDRRLALQAMVNDPLVPSLQTARAMLDDLLEAHAAHLPQFKKRVAVAA